MDFKIQLAGLNELLAAIYGSETQLNTLLRDLGFEQIQIEQLRDKHLEALVSKFLESIHERLTSDSGKDVYYQILSRRYGLNGEPPESLEAVARKRNISREYLGQLFKDILDRCRTKTAQNEFRKNLKHLAVAQLAATSDRPTREHVAGKLERLTNLRGAADITRLDYEAKRAEILKKVQAELDVLDAEYKPLLEAADENIAALETEIKTDVLLHGESVSGGTYRAVYMQGRVSWDNEGITKYAIMHPDVLKFRNQAQPTVSLRVVNDKR
jgi:AraC-like DNA-binding protein